MPSDRRPIAFSIIVVFLAVSIILMLLGQTMAVFNYDLAVLGKYEWDRVTWLEYYGFI